MNIITPYRVVVVDVVVVTAVCSSVAVQIVDIICNGCKYMYRGKCKELNLIVCHSLNKGVAYNINLTYGANGFHISHGSAQFSTHQFYWMKTNYFVHRY